MGSNCTSTANANAACESVCERPLVGVSPCCATQASSERRPAANSNSLRNGRSKNSRKQFFDGHTFRSSLGGQIHPHVNNNSNTLYTTTAKKTSRSNSSKSMMANGEPHAEVLAQVNLMKSEAKPTSRHRAKPSIPPLAKAPSALSAVSFHAESSNKDSSAMKSTCTSSGLADDLCVTLLRNDAFD